MIFLSGDPAS